MNFQNALLSTFMPYALASAFSCLQLHLRLNRRGDVGRSQFWWMPVGKKIDISNFFPPALHLETFSGVLIIAAFSAFFTNSQTQDILKGRNAKAPKAAECTDTGGKKTTKHPTTKALSDTHLVISTCPGAWLLFHQCWA